MNSETKRAFQVKSEMNKGLRTTDLIEVNQTINTVRRKLQNRIRKDAEPGDLFYTIERDGLENAYLVKEEMK